MAQDRPDAPKTPIKDPPPPKKDKRERELPPKVDNPDMPRIVDPGPV